jgi:lipopolysaccharide assembly outer membrane protein LptD (OstA)
MKFLFYIFFFIICFNYSDAQRIRLDSANMQKHLKKADSLRQSENLIKIKQQSSLDTNIIYSANDTVATKIKSKSMRLRGEASLEMGSQSIESEIIEISIENTTLKAFGIEDTNGVIQGYPVINDRGQEFAGESMLFNYKTKKGNIVLGETNMEQGFYYGDKIKKIDDASLFIKDGKYTTCEPPEDSYYFGSPKMKIIVKDKIFLDPLILYVQDMPVFMVPFGLFLPNKSGRQSGIMIPAFYFSKSRGVAFDDLGFYWAASDYWDTQIKASIYTKGGYILKNNTRWALRDIFKGDVNLEFGKTRNSLDEDWKNNYKIGLRHDHTLSPTAKINANIDFMSQDFNRNTSMISSQRIQQNASSRASYSKTFQNKSNFSISYDRNQNIIDGTYDQSIPISYSLPSYKPLQNVKSLPRWMQNFQTRYSVNAKYSNSKDLETERIFFNADSSYLDTNYISTTNRRIEHRPSISISPKLGYFTVSPSVSFSANNYFRRLTRYMNPDDSTLVESYETGFFTEYNYSMGLRTSTKIYGIFDNRQKLFGFIKPSVFGIEAARHTYEPSLSYSFSPDLSDNEYGFYDTYYDYANEEERRYSRYASDGGGLASSSLSQRISYSDNHTFEIKVPQGDTLPAENLELMRMNLSTNYNLAADSLKLSDLTVGFRSNALKFLEFNGNASFTPYNQLKILTFNPKTGQTTETYKKVNTLRISEGKSLYRLTNFRINLSTSYSSQKKSGGIGKSSRQTVDEESEETDTTSEESKLGKRFEIGNKGKERIDFFGEYNPGYSPILFPWSVNVGIEYSYSQPTINLDSKNESLYLRLSGNFKLTKSWNINFNTGFDVIEQELRAPNINISKRIGCDWEFILNWTPIGPNRGFYAKFGIAVPQLQDLKLEKRNNPLVR